MKRERITKAIAMLSVVAMLVTSLAGCSAQEAVEEETTTTEPTTVTTTEDMATTFAETSTTEIYEGLKKDNDGSYPYEISSYTTTYNGSNATRTANLKNAVSKLNNIAIPDGALFSFNQTVGKRTMTGGYESALVIKNGEFVDGLGGGICQVSSTVFQAVLKANMEIVRRTNHSLEIGYVPLGGDATVQWNSKDFQFKNDMGCDAKLVMTCSNGRLTCQVFAKEDVNPGDVKISISKEGKDYVLTRTVNGEKNYTTRSRYKKPKTETEKKKKDKDKKDKEKDKDKDKNKDKESTTKKAENQ